MPDYIDRSRTVSDPVLPQPIANLGDVNFLEHGGVLLFHDEDPEWGYSETWGEIIEPPEDTDTDEGPWTVYRFDIDQLRRVEDDGEVYLVRSGWSEGDPPSVFAEWFSDKIGSAADSHGLDVDELRGQFCSEDPVERLHAYGVVVAGHWGPFELDQYPLKLSQHEAFTRYGQREDCYCSRCQWDQEMAGP